MTKRWAAGVSILAIAGGFLGSGSALAVPTTPGSTADAVSVANNVHLEGAPPNCFHTNAVGGSVTVTVNYNNTCKTNQRVKFIIDRAADSACISIPGGQKGWWRSGGGARPELNHTVTC